MKRILHLLRWHLSHYRWLVAGILLVTIVLASIPLLGIATRDAEPVFFLSLIPYLGGAALLCTMLVHSQPHTGSDSFWMTRAFSRREFLVAQYLVLFLVLAAPSLFTLCVHAVWMDGSVFTAIQVWLILFGMMSAIFAAAVLTSNVFYTSALVFAAFFVFGFTADALDTRIEGLDFNPRTIFISFPLCGLIALLISGIFRYRLWTGRALFVAFALLIPAIGLSMPQFMKRIEMLSSIKSISLSFRDDPGDSPDALSFISNTLVEAGNKNLLIVPTQARVVSESKSYVLDYWDVEIASLAPDAILRHFPSDAMIRAQYSSIGSSSLESGLGMRIRNESGSRSTREMKIDTETEGEVWSDVYEVLPLGVIPFQEGERSTREGHSIQVHTIKKSATKQEVEFTLERFGTEGLFPRSGDTHYSIVLFSPSAGSGVCGEINEFYGRGTYSPVVEGRTDTLAFPLNGTFTEADDVEMHVFMICSLRQRLHSAMKFQPGIYQSNDGSRKGSDPDFASIKDLDTFTDSWLEKALSPGANHVKNQSRESLLARSDSELETILKTMVGRDVPLLLFEECFRGRKSAARLPIDLLVDLAPEHPVLFDLVMRHKKSGKGVPAADALLKSSDAIFPPGVSILAARSGDETLVPKLKEQFLASKTELNRFHDALEPLIDEKELAEMIDITWRKAEVEIISDYRIAPTASRYGHRGALASLIISMESQSPKQRPNTDQFKEIKAQINLSPEQGKWDEAKLAKWISDRAGDFQYSPESRKWFAER